MAQKYAVVVAVEKYLRPTQFSAVQFAEADAQRFAKSIQGLSFDDADVSILLNENATHASIGSRIHKVLDLLAPGDLFFFYYAGHGLHFSGENFITCYDTDRSDISHTAHGLKQLLDGFTRAENTQTVFFVDACHSGLRLSIPDSSRDVLSEFSPEELRAYFKNSEFLVCFSSCKEGQQSFPSTKLGHGVWTYCLVEALEGRRKDAVHKDGLITATSLQTYLSERVKTLMRELFEDGRKQTPAMLASSTTAEFLVADVTEVIEKRRAEEGAASANRAGAVNVKRSVFVRDLRKFRVESLVGFKKGFHRVPDRVADRQQAFIRDVGSDDLRREFDTLALGIRNTFELKRRDGTSGQGDGILTFQTSQFRAALGLHQHEGDPGTAVLKLEVDMIDSASVLASDAFDDVFDGFERVELSLSGSVDVAAVIDAVEDMKDKSVEVDYPTDATECTITVAKSDVLIKVTENMLVFSVVGGVAPARALLAEASRTVGLLAAAKVPLLGE